MFELKTKMARRIRNNGTKDIKTMVPSRYLSNLWRTLEMSLINCEISVILTWSENCFIMNAPVGNQVTIFAITDMKLYVPIATL